MNMHNPPHPGELIKIFLIEDEDGNKIDSIANVANKLGVSRSALNNVINGSASLSLELALKLESIGSGSAEMWAKMQSDYTLWQLRNQSVA